MKYAVHFFNELACTHNFFLVFYSKKNGNDETTRDGCTRMGLGECLEGSMWSNVSVVRVGCCWGTANQ